jgi:hypothetical protein
LPPINCYAAQLNLCLTVSRALEHYEMLKSKYLTDMENRRLRTQLGRISELANESLAQKAHPTMIGESNETSQKVYELRG